MTRLAGLLLSAALGVVLCAGEVCAQDKARGKTAAANASKPAKPASQRKAAVPKAKRGKTRQAEEPLKPARAESHPSAVAHAPPPMAADDEGDVRKEGGTEVKTLEFTGLDIEGQLKTPQMLYFLNRLRAEFSRPELPHRSFIPELSRSSKDKEL